MISKRVYSKFLIVLIIFMMFTAIPTQATQAANSQAVTTTAYADLVVDEARGRLYGADKNRDKVDVIDMGTLSIVSSYQLASDSAPAQMELSPNGNELAVAQAGSSQVKFINLRNGLVTELAVELSPIGARARDVIYGRNGILYILSTNGIHVVDTTVSPHAEIPEQQALFPVRYFDAKGVISEDKNSLFLSLLDTSNCQLKKFDVSEGLSKPTETKSTFLSNHWC